MPSLQELSKCTLTPSCIHAHSTVLVNAGWLWSYKPAVEVSAHLLSGKDEIPDQDSSSEAKMNAQHK